MTSAERPPAASVEVSGVDKTYRTRGTAVNAVRGLDLSIRTGETVAVLGPNRAGKSTTLDMLLGLTAPDPQTVSVPGRHPREAVGRTADWLPTGRRPKSARWSGAGRSH